ncbi:GntR family transcriptional regulator [Celeribacter arenosi]|uniref:GntR family transcriptional regulator n=1 Tax=Celeribacter arenosi TaxID=792649 RepID=A0ABP7K4I7_9RHOB
MAKKSTVINLPAEYVLRIDPHRPAAEQIASCLKAAMLEMSLKPGQIISESEVANLYGASRTPVREAFTWLRDQGFVVTYPNRGTYVSKLSIPQIKGAQFARESLEVAIAEHLCDHGLPVATVEEVEANLDLQEKLTKSGNGDAFHKLDDDFHLALASAVGHPRICDIVQKEKAILDRLRVLSLNSMDHISVLVHDHRAIFEAIQSGSKSSARKQVRLHLRRVLDTLSDLFETHREYFDD